MKLLYDTLAQKPAVYVTRDLDRALGLPLNTPGYYIIANSSPNAKQIAGGRENVLLIEAERQLDTWELLEHPETKCQMSNVPAGRGQMLVFKPSKKIEQICSRNNWQLLNPPAELAGKIEEKITQLSFLPELIDLFPKYEVTNFLIFKFSNFPFVIQFNHSHTGVGTHLIENENQHNALKQKFPNREVRVTNFIDGPIFTNNNVVTNAGILIGNISYQITGLKPYTDNPFATVGNDWGIVKKILTPRQIQQYNNIAVKVGHALKTKGWKGLFGIDVIENKQTGQLYLLEINARQPQSATYESQLQQLVNNPLPSREGRGKGLNADTLATNNNLKSKIATFEAHLASLLNLDLSNAELIKIDNGAQIIDRRTNEWYRTNESLMLDHKILRSDA